METVIIGLGEIGRPLYEILRSTFDTYGYDVRGGDLTKQA